MKEAELKKEYKKRKKDIKQRLVDFSKVDSKDLFYEFCFCILTPQSNAFKCADAIEILKKKDFENTHVNPRPILKTKTRFYKNKSNYLLENKNKYQTIKEIVENKNNALETRSWIIKNVKGMGYKEASHFLRNVGYRNLAILDRHILKHLVNLKVINELPKNLNAKKYEEIEKKFINYSSKIGIHMDELDLLFWSMQTGVIFK